MSTKLFPRSWKIIVDTLDVSNLPIEFKVLSTIKAEPNKCVLTVWELKADHRAQLLKRNRPKGGGQQTGKIVGIPVQIEAGYLDNTSVIFSGDLREVASMKDGVDWKTMLSGDDGGRAYREARFPNGGASFTAGTPIGTILQQCAQAMGVGIGNAANFTATAQIAGLGSTIPHNMTLDGSVAKQLTRLIKSIGLTWSIQKGALQLAQRGAPLGGTAVLLAPNTGLYGSPEATIDATVSLGNAQQFAPGAPQTQKAPPKPKDPGILKLKTALIPGLTPGRKIDLQSAAFNGGYMITEIEYVGQSWAPTWECNIVARIY
jgi:hypothetical protein